MAATNSGARAAILREVGRELDRLDTTSSVPPTTWDYASAVAQRLVGIANEVANPGPVEGRDYLNAAGTQLVCIRHDRRAMVYDNALVHIVDSTPCIGSED